MIVNKQSRCPCQSRYPDISPGHIPRTFTPARWSVIQIYRRMCCDNCYESNFYSSNAQLS